MSTRNGERPGSKQPSHTSEWHPPTPTNTQSDPCSLPAAGQASVLGGTQGDVVTCETWEEKCSFTGEITTLPATNGAGLSCPAVTVILVPLQPAPLSPGAR